MTAPPPLPMQWDGEAFRPLPRFARHADRHYVVGEVYSMVPHEDRSDASHRHYFAALKDAWENLPAPWSSMFLTAEHLRRYALIRTGYANRMDIACASKAEALRAVARLRGIDEYALVEATEAVVTIWTAHSQSYRAMGAEQFKASKRAVLDFVAGLIGVTADQLERNSGRAA
jgi:hypothetical protein